ncbi:MAG: tRNA (adenosine(37)-N6)-threonylcarbamoyltransferase complex dimerization subunit type 1 TsaB [Candidatus Humimicrobiaceae bacterium]
MKTILAVDSTSEILSISLSEGHNILSEIRDDKSIRHMVNIISDIEHVLKKADKTIKEIDIFALNLGPGDFTGGRIGISIIKIFSMLSGNQIYGFNALDIFSVGAMLKNIKSISNTVSDSGRIYIIPVMDVRNNEIYCGIYEVGINNNENKTIFSFDFENRKYFLNKIFGNFLIKSDELNKKMLQITEQLNLLENCSCSSCAKIFKRNISQEDPEIKNTHKNINRLERKKSKFILTASAVKTYRSLLEEIKTEVTLSQSDAEIIIEEENINPSSISVNFLAEYSYSFLRETLPIEPVYIRDFVAFNKK